MLHAAAPTAAVQSTKLPVLPVGILGEGRAAGSRAGTAGLGGLTSSLWPGVSLLQTRTVCTALLLLSRSR